MLQPFPTSFARNQSIFVAASGTIKDVEDRSHRHDFYELVWLWQGACTYFCDFEQYVIPTGTLIFISPGQLHDYRYPTEECRLLIIGFRSNLLPSVAHHLLNLLPFDDSASKPIVEIEPMKKMGFEQLFRAAHTRFDAADIGWEAIALSYLQTILTEAAYLMPVERINQAASAPVQLTRAFQKAMEQHYKTERQVQVYADMLGVTSNYLVKTIRETTMTTPKKMLRDRLLLEAKRLLMHTPYNISEIAKLLQFPNGTTFARWFRSAVEMTPTEFRLSE